MDDILALLMGEDPTEQERTRTLADALRGQREAAMIASVMGRRAQPLARLMGEDFQNQQELTARSEQQRLTRALQSQQFGRRMSLDEKELAERTRHNKATEAMGRPGPSFVIVTDGRGRQYFVDPKDPKKPAVPVQGPDGEQLEKPRAQKSIPVGERNELVDLTEKYNALSYLHDSFKPEFAGHGLLGPLKKAGAQALGEWGTDNMEAMANWWSDYETLFELPARNKTFGASLTPQEKRTWDNAQRIAASKKPADVLKGLSMVRDVYANKINSRGSALSAEGYNEEAVHELSGGLVGSEPSRPTAKKEKPATSKPVRIATDEEFEALPAGTIFVGPDGVERQK